PATAPPTLHSFPTPRSSDLAVLPAAAIRSTSDRTRAAQTPAREAPPETATITGRIGFAAPHFLAHSAKRSSSVCLCPTCIVAGEDRKSTRLNSSHVKISYAV